MTQENQEDSDLIYFFGDEGLDQIAMERIERTKRPSEQDTVYAGFDFENKVIAVTNERVLISAHNDRIEFNHPYERIRSATREGRTIVLTIGQGMNIQRHTYQMGNDEVVQDLVELINEQKQLSQNPGSAPKPQTSNETSRENPGAGQNPGIAERVRFWEEQDRINQALIPRVVQQNKLLGEHIADHENLPMVAARAIREAVEPVLEETKRNLELAKDERDKQAGLLRESQEEREKLAEQARKDQAEREQQAKQHREALDELKQQTAALRKMRTITVGASTAAVIAGNRRHRPGSYSIRIMMTMESTNLLPELLQLPTDQGNPHRSTREHMAGLINGDRTLLALEYSAAVSVGLWAVFDQINVDDVLQAAYEAQYPGLAADHSLYDQWQEMIDRGPEAMDGFINSLKGKIAEFQVQDQLTEAGWTNVTIASDPTQSVWDIHGISPEGTLEYWQVKTGAESYAGEIQGLMLDNPDLNFAVSTEIYDQIADSTPELIGQMFDNGADYLLVGDTTDGLETLTDNLGIDVPDGVGELIPYAGAIIAGARLIHSVISTEQQFKAADRTTRNKIQVVQTLTLMSRMGINTVLATVGGMGGAAAGSFLPVIGNLVGGLVGTVAGAGMGMYLNQHLQPHMLSLALDITGLEEDDLFYYKNRPRIDELALSFRQTALQLPAAV